MMISWWSKLVGVLLSVLMCDILHYSFIIYKCICWIIILSGLLNALHFVYKMFVDIIKYVFTSA
jgi:hypothetical protein